VALWAPEDGAKRPQQRNTMAQIRLRGIHLAFGPDKLLDDAELVIEQGDRIAILGRNGQGKSTLLKVLDGEIEPDDGEIVRSDGVKIARLQQEVPSGEDHRTVFEVAASGLGDNAALALKQLETDGYTDIELEGTDIWRATADIQSIISRLLLDPDSTVSSLSGGQKRRVMLARALAAQPNVLLMDEPTNHLDIDSVIWLEEFLSKITATLIFVTHDRSLIRKLSNRIVDIDRGTVTNWNHPYDKFLQLREEAIAAAETQDKLFDKKLKQEETWIRQGIKARRTRNEGRVRALKKLREERAQRRAKIGKAELNVQTDSKSGKIVFKLDKITKPRCLNLYWVNWNRIRALQLQAPILKSPTSISYVINLTKVKQRQKTWVKAATSLKSTVSANTLWGTCRIFCLIRNARARQSTNSPAVSATDCCWPNFSLKLLTCWCLMSQPMILTSKP